MIATLRGRLAEKLPDTLVLEAAGVGYELFVTTETWGAARLGAEAHYYIHDHLREDSHALYAFVDLATKQLFTQLLSVSGVGPKVALGILSAAGSDRLRQALNAGDPDLLRGVSGVGPKTAQRIVMELRGKVEAGATGLAPVADPTYQALVALGYTPPAASAAVAALPPDLAGDQARLKAALKAAA